MKGRVCHRHVTERPDVLPNERLFYRCERPAVLPNDRVCYRCVTRYRTTGCATGMLPNDRVLAVCYRTTVRVAERLGVLPHDRVCYRRVVMWNL